ncbi:MAG: hypothetical protein M1830_009296 [Pleopsidium flavum]|nr:MAG: hypothetical protein M1830_009296 [Pleopsidium flavum]
MALSIIPLMLRMGLVHVILIWGTNNAVTTGLTDVEIQHREIGSKLVLASRIMYAAFLWVAKFTISEFLKRLTGQFWRRSYEVGLQFIRYFLVITFGGVVIATLVECQPVSHYWQVVPDPGPKCRQGYTQLITMGTCDIITDLLLVGFPIPIVIVSAIPMKRKVSLVLLFALSLILVAITSYRVPAIIDRRGSQHFRSLLASLEILAAAAVSNALVLGSFVRDRGVKIQRFRFGSTSDSMERSSTRRGTVTAHHWGSDADLVSDLGMRLDPELHETESVPRPAPVALPMSGKARRNPLGVVDRNWQFPASKTTPMDDDEIDIKGPVSEPEGRHSSSEVSQMTPRRMSFFDVGGLLENGDRARSLHTVTATNGHIPSSPQRRDFTTSSSARRGSRVLLQDIGGLLSPHDESLPSSSPTRSFSPSPTRNFSSPPTRNFSRPVPTQLRFPDRPSASAAAARTRTPSSDLSSVSCTTQDSPQSLQDVGGLLGLR